MKRSLQHLAIDAALIFTKPWGMVMVNAIAGGRGSLRTR
jgi:hypothetical protein